MDAQGSSEPHIDPSQDYILLKGYENNTHTLLRFRRKLDTCDYEHDIVINVCKTLAPLTSTTKRNYYVI